MNYSDHKKPYNNINTYLPEVYQSDVNTSVFDTAFNRHLTKDDTTRVAGFVGEGNPQALRNRQITEATPHRQAFQLAPTMFSTVGTVENALSFKAFQGQLELMGVNLNRMDKWGNTLQFNWAPPINFDMFVNYQDYFWKPNNAQETTQYFSIENRCNKALSKVESYANVLALRGNSFPIIRIGYSNDTFIISDKLDDLFVDGFLFYTDGSSNINLLNKAWNVASSSYDLLTNETTITVVESIASAGSASPVSPYVGQWWYDMNTSTLKEWNGTTWVLTVQAQAANVNLERLLANYQYEANCICNQSFGWDTTAWDFGDGSQWDYSADCVEQELNQWSDQNRWIHKTQVQSFADVRRAQAPILEYSSSVELNTWTKSITNWKYRADVDLPFELSSVPPKRFELEPIKNFIVDSVGGKWVVYLFGNGQMINRDIDYTNTFVSGYRFRVTDDTNVAQVYTVSASEYRQLDSTLDSALVLTNASAGVMCTIITLKETVYTAQMLGGGSNRARLEPVVTSRGDSWNGYHYHWVLDPSATTYVASAPRSDNPFLLEGLASPTTAPPPPGFIPTNSTISTGALHQELILDNAGVTRIDLLNKFTCADGTNNIYATPSSNELRVYVNGIRQYATYTEIIATATATTFTVSDFYTVVGQSTQTTQYIRYVEAIVFNQPLAQYDVVRIEIGPAAVDDMGLYAVPIRTVEDEAEFAALTVTGQQPAYLSISTFQKQEQTKRTANQYPLFNVYDISTSEVINATSLFAYHEDSSYPINPVLGLRVVADISSKQFEFEQLLLDRDDNMLYAYRNLANNTTGFWFNTSSQTLYFWDGRTWTSKIAVSIGGVRGYRTAFVQPYEPTGDQVYQLSYWFNTLTKQLFQYNGSSWVSAPVPQISSTDPSLQTIWRRGSNNEQYVPQWVDASRQPLTINDPNGDWEVVDQWRFNAQHENKQVVKFSQVLTHFKSILGAQPPIPGLQGGGIYTLTQNDINYGLGGTIKEHNDGFDTLISAVNVRNVTPVGVIEFAAQQYATCQVFVRDLYNKSIDKLMSSLNQQALADLSGYLANSVIALYEANDFVAQLYGDTTAFDPATGKGVRNWVATAPMMGLSPVYRPHLTYTNKKTQLFYHDGHRNDIEYTSVEYDKYARMICGYSDPRLPNGTFGKIAAPSTPLPTTGTSLVTHMGYLRPSLYWYMVGSGQRQLYRFAPYSVGSVPPSFYYESGGVIPDGTKYFNTTTLATYEKVGLSWIPITTVGADDITPLWEEIDFGMMLGKILLEVETRLYEVTPQNYTSFDYATLTPNAGEQAEYDRLLRERFATFLTTYGLTTPFSNTDYTAQNPFTWNYASCIMLTPPRLDVTPATPACWQELYTRWYGTPYPHLEPWKLQGFHDKPVWWDEEYLDTTGTRRWIYDHSTTTGMWENIRTGVIPPGRTYPNGDLVVGSQILPTYLYFSVNISNNTIAGSYAPDALLPPYYDNSAIAGTMPTVRSMFTTYSSEIIAPDADFAFGDVGPTEWVWSVSSQRPYDEPIIAFLMQPAKMLHSTFGVNFTVVDGLQVDLLAKQVYSHADVLFHGDLYDTNKVFLARGLNQWYVNYNRFTGADTNGEFRQLWASWRPRLTYQFGGIVDTSTFEITSKYFDLIDQDYNIILANNGVINDVWLDAFEVSLLSIPPALVQYNNQAAWKMEIDNLSSTARDIQYFGVRSYQFTINKTTNEGTAFNFPMLAANAPARRFTIGGDYTSIFTPGTTITITDSPWNNGNYTITSSVFETSSNRTRINVLEPVASSNVAGFINLNKNLPWQTGDEVVISSTKFVPAPLLPDTIYYVIRTAAKTFKLAETRADALNNIAIDLTSVGDGTLTISQLDSSFQVFGGQGNTTDIWYHYAIDTDDIKTFSPPYTVLGMQALINLIDGYAAFKKQQGVLLNVADANSNNFDPDTGRLVGWDVETERFIDWAYGLRQARVTISDRYPVTINTTLNTLTFGAAVPMWLSGTAVSAVSSGDLPSPLIDGATYYIVNTGTAGVIQLSTSANALDSSAIIDLTTTGTGQLTLGLFNKNRVFPRFELNPTRNHMWIDTPLGVLSNAVTGPYADIRINQTIFDQYSRPLGPDKVTVFRQDERSHITVRSELSNDVDPIYVDDPYNYIHMGGAHLFIEGYEHFLIFNDYTVGGALIYDPFFGLQTSKFGVDYFEKEQYTLRPTLGGYYLLDQEFKRNIEGSASDFQNYYDVMELSESSEVAKRSRATLGYKGRTDYLDFLNINKKSQFMFYRGLIQTKGSVNSIKAYINSRRFVDAKVDEYWAWKISNFGDSRDRVYPEIKLFAVDGVLDDVRLEFLASSENVNDPDVVDSIYKGFQPVTFNDETRWNIFPEQKSIIKSPLFLDAAVTSLITIHSSITPPPPGAESTINYWFNTDEQKLYSYDPLAQGFNKWTADVTNGRVLVQSANINNLATTNFVYLRLDEPTDTVRVIHKALASSTINIDTIVAGTSQQFTLAGDRTGDITVGVPFGVTGSTNNDGAYYPSQVTYNGTNTIITVEGTVAAPGLAPGVIIVKDFATYNLEVYNQGDGLREVQRVDSQVLRFQLNGFQDILQIFLLNAPSTRLSPAQLIDVKANAVVQQIPMWDPARGLHSHMAIHNVDLQSNVDPARYQFTPSPTATNENFWNENEVGTVWLNTAELGYLTYYDDKVYPDINNRLYNWGKLAPWGSVKVYQWVSSPVPPEQWDARVIQDAADPLLQQNNKATGTPRKTVFKRVRQPFSVTNINTTSSQVTIPGLNASPYDTVLFTATELPAGIESGVKYIIRTVVAPNVYTLTNPITEDVVTITTTGVNVVAVPTFMPQDWVAQTLIRDRAFAPFVAGISRTEANINPLLNPLVWPYTLPAVSGENRLYWTPSNPTLWITGSGVGADSVDVYINGVLYTSSQAVEVDGSNFYVVLTTTVSLNEYDIVDFVRQTHSVTAEEAEFDPDVEDDGTQMIQWKEHFEYCSRTISVGGNNTGIVEQTNYYFWVEGATNNNPAIQDDLSVFEIAQQIKTIPTPYFVVQRPKDDPYLVEKYGYGMIQYGSVFSSGILTEADYQIPVLYREAVIRKVASYLDDDNRYIVRFTRDFALRDDIQANGRQMNLKNKHQEWYLFRKAQTSALPRELWDRLTEALIGYKLPTTRTVTILGQPLTFSTVGQTVFVGQTNVSGMYLDGLMVNVDYSVNELAGTVTLLTSAKYPDPAPFKTKVSYTYETTTGTSIRVPSLERELYDALYGTDTQYGLGEDQAFVNKTLALNTIVNYLSDPTKDFMPMDIDTFFATYKFDTPENIIAAMDTIYTTFNATHVNAIWFETLLDAFSTRAKYKELLKTSWIALHGIRVLEVGGLFDD